MMHISHTQQVSHDKAISEAASCAVYDAEERKGLWLAILQEESSTPDQCPIESII